MGRWAAFLLAVAILSGVFVLAGRSMRLGEDPAIRCADALVSVGLDNAATSTDATGQARPRACRGLTEDEYGAARHDATLRLASLLSRPTR